MKTILAETSTTSYQLSSKKQQDLDERPTNGLLVPTNAAAQSLMEFGCNTNQPVAMNTGEQDVEMDATPMDEVFHQRPVMHAGAMQCARAEEPEHTGANYIKKKEVGPSSGVPSTGSGAAKDVMADKTRSAAAQQPATPLDGSLVMNNNNNVKHSHSLRRHLPRIVVKSIAPEKKLAAPECTSSSGSQIMTASTAAASLSQTITAPLPAAVPAAAPSITRSGPSRRAQQLAAKATGAGHGLDGTGMAAATATAASGSLPVITQASTMREVLASIPGFSIKPRRRSSKKISTAAQIEQTKDGKIDLETPDSILASTNLRALLNKQTFSLLPPLYQYNLIQLLPLVDREAIELEHKCSTFPGPAMEAVRLGASSLNNEFFARACLEWRERLSEGEFTPENQMKLRAEAERERNKLDPWKLKHFEPIWGEKSRRRAAHNATANQAGSCDGLDTKATSAVAAAGCGIDEPDTAAAQLKGIEAAAATAIDEKPTTTGQVIKTEEESSTLEARVDCTSDCGHVTSPPTADPPDGQAQRDNAEQQQPAVADAGDLHNLDCDDTDSASRCTLQDMQEHSDQSRLTDANSLQASAAALAIDSDSGVVLQKFTLKRSASQRIGGDTTTTTRTIGSSALSDGSPNSSPLLHTLALSGKVKKSETMCLTELVDIAKLLQSTQSAQQVTRHDPYDVPLVGDDSAPGLNDVFAGDEEQMAAAAADLRMDTDESHATAVCADNQLDNDEDVESADVALSLMHYLNETDLDNMEVEMQSDNCLPADCGPSEEDEDEEELAQAIATTITSTNALSAVTPATTANTTTTTISVKTSACDTIKQSSMPLQHSMPPTAASVSAAANAAAVILKTADCQEATPPVVVNGQLPGVSERLLPATDCNREQRDYRLDGVCGKKMRFSCVTDIAVVGHSLPDKYRSDATTAAVHSTATGGLMDYQSAAASLNGRTIATANALPTKTTTATLSLLSSLCGAAPTTGAATVSGVKCNNVSGKTMLSSELPPPVAITTTPAFLSTSTAAAAANQSTHHAPMKQQVMIAGHATKPSPIELFQQVVQHDWNFGALGTIKCDPFESDSTKQLSQMRPDLSDVIRQAFQQPLPAQQSQQQQCRMSSSPDTAGESLDTDFSEIAASTSQCLMSLPNERVLGDVCQYILDASADNGDGVDNADHDCDGDDLDDDDDDDEDGDDETDKSGEGPDDEEGDDVAAADDGDGNDDDIVGAVGRQCDGLGLVESNGSIENAGADGEEIDSNCETLVENVGIIVEQLQQQQQQYLQQHQQALINSNSVEPQSAMALFLQESKLFGQADAKAAANAFAVETKVDYANEVAAETPLCSVVPFAVADMEVSSTVSTNSASHDGGVGKVNLNFQRPQLQPKHLTQAALQQQGVQQQPPQQHQILVDSNGHIIGNILVQQHQHAQQHQLLQQNLAQQFTIQSSAIAAQQGVTPLVATTTARALNQHQQHHHHHQQQQQQHKLFQPLSIMRKPYEVNTDVHYSANQQHNSFVSRTLTVQNAVAGNLPQAQMQQIITQHQQQPRQVQHQQQHAPSAMLDDTGGVKVTMPPYGDRLPLPVASLAQHHLGHLNQAKIQTLPSHIQHQLDPCYPVGVVPASGTTTNEVVSASSPTQHYASKQINLITIPRTVGKCSSTATAATNLPVPVSSVSLGCASIASAPSTAAGGVNTYAYVSAPQPQHSPSNFSLITSLMPASGGGASTTAVPGAIKLIPTSNGVVTTGGGVNVSAGSVTHHHPALSPSPPQLSAPPPPAAAMRLAVKPTTAGKNRKTVNNKLPPGAVNLERSYQICQAVIQNSPNRENLKAQLRPPPSIFSLQQQQQQQTNNTAVGNITAVPKVSPSLVGGIQSMAQCIANVVAGNSEEIPANILPSGIASANVMGMGRPGVYKIIGPHMRFPRKKYVQRKSPTIMREVLALHAAASHGGGGGTSSDLIQATLAQQLALMPKATLVQQQQQLHQPSQHTATEIHRNNGQYVLVHRTNLVKADNQTPRASSAPPIPQNQNQLHINGMPMTGRGRPASVDVDTSVNMLNDIQNIGYANVNATNTTANTNVRNINAGVDVSQVSTDDERIMDVVAIANDCNNQLVAMATLTTAAANVTPATTTTGAAAAATMANALTRQATATVGAGVVAASPAAKQERSAAATAGIELTTTTTTTTTTRTPQNQMLAATAATAAVSSPCYVSDAVKSKFIDNVMGRHCSSSSSSSSNSNSNSSSNSNSNSSSNSSSSNSSSSNSSDVGGGSRSGGGGNGNINSVIDTRNGGVVNANAVLTSSNHPTAANNMENCGCSLNAMIICKECGAFFHKDCMNSSKLCLACIIR